MAVIRMTAQEARDYVKSNNGQLQSMYDYAPYSDEDPNPDAAPVARGFSAFKEYLVKREKELEKQEHILQT